MLTKKQTTERVLCYLTLATIFFGLIIFVWAQKNYLTQAPQAKQSFMETLGSSPGNPSTSEKVRHVLTNLTIVLFFFMVLLTLYYVSVSSLK